MDQLNDWSRINYYRRFTYYTYAMFAFLEETLERGDEVIEKEEDEDPNFIGPRIPKSGDDLESGNKPAE